MKECDTDSLVGQASNVNFLFIEYYIDEGSVSAMFCS